MTKLTMKWFILLISLVVGGILVYLWLFPANDEKGPPNAVQNIPSNLSERVSAPRLSIPGGFYAEGILLALDASEKQGVIRYTLDGSEPTKASPVYKESIAIKETTVVKARTYLSDKLSSTVVTATYFIGQSQSLAVFSLSTNPDN
ncbi:chitobiase/beta-hexosaminidase C-terminal domain-containing protein, partial [Paenibacillus sp. TAF58]